MYVGHCPIHNYDASDFHKHDGQAIVFINTNVWYFEHKPRLFAGDLSFWCRIQGIAKRLGMGSALANYI